MSGTLDDALGRAAARWVGVASRRAGIVVAVLLVTSGVLLVAGWPKLGVDSNEDTLFRESVPHVPARRAWRELFPRFRDPIVVVIEAVDADAAHAAAQRLADRLALLPELFPELDVPGGGAFFERNALLYLETDELDELATRLSGAQPFLASLAADPSLRGLLPLLGDAIESSGELSTGSFDLEEAIDRVSEVLEAGARGEPTRLAWSEWLMGDGAPEDGRRRFVLAQPAYDFTRLNPAGESIDALRGVLDELGLTWSDGGPARARMTGVYVLAADEAAQVSQQSTWAGMASFVLVGLVLGFGLRSVRLVVASLATLVLGLALTASFAAFAIGHLNLISVAFAVLFIGLSIDFAIHLCVRFQELVNEGCDCEAALAGAAEEVGGSLVICAATTAIGFYSFLPTPYRGVAELGAIAGTGMFVSVFTNLTFLPALLRLWGPPRAQSVANQPRVSRLASLPVRHRRPVLVAAALLTVAGIATLPRVDFDGNPLRVRDPNAESVQVFDELLERGEAFPWNLSALAPDAEAAAALGGRLEALPSVDSTLTLADFVPDDQEEKLAIISDLDFLLGPSLATRSRPPPDAAMRSDAISALLVRLRALDLSTLPDETARAAARLASALADWEDAAPARLEALERGLVDTLPEQLRLLRTALEAGPVDEAALPASLREAWIASDGRVRVEVFPAEDLDEDDALARYVHDVRDMVPDAYGEGWVIWESGEMVVSSLKQALATAAALVLVTLLMLWRHPGHAALVLAPLGLAALLTCAITVWLGVPLNFANVIVIPLLLGMGVDSGIHLVHRLRGPTLPGSGLLGTGTARAVLLSALTTIASFGTLAASSHPGLSSLGRLLAVGLVMILICNLGVLPALAARRASGR